LEDCAIPDWFGVGPAFEDAEVPDAACTPDPVARPVVVGLGPVASLGEDVVAEASLADVDASSGSESVSALMDETMSLTRPNAFLAPCDKRPQKPRSSSASAASTGEHAEGEKAGAELLP
jgi:hypothetical protein